MDENNNQIKKNMEVKVDLLLIRFFFEYQTHMEEELLW